MGNFEHREIERVSTGTFFLLRKKLNNIPLSE